MRAHGLLKLLMRIRTSWRPAAGVVEESGAQPGPRLTHVPVQLPAPEVCGTWAFSQADGAAPAASANAQAEAPAREESETVAEGNVAAAGSAASEPAGALASTSPGVPAMDV
eukprot:7491207-Lingulodinium_polyedra.AAC.1